MLNHIDLCEYPEANRIGRERYFFLLVPVEGERQGSWGVKSGVAGTVGWLIEKSCFDSGQSESLV